MLKKIGLFLLCISVVFGVEFKEKRYIYAVDKTLFFEGNITFLPKSIHIEYTKPKEQNLTYSSDDEQIQKRYFFTLLHAIYENDESLLNEFFQTKTKDDITTLLPLEKVQEYIKKVVYKKVGNHLEFLKIFMQNDDRIEIETLQ